MAFLVSHGWHQRRLGKGAKSCHCKLDGTGEFKNGDLLLPGGFHQLIAATAEGIDSRLGVQLARIDTSGGEAKVHDTRGGVWSADVVIVTLPLGVLKAGDVRFEPSPADTGAARHRPARHWCARQGRGGLARTSAPH